MKKIAKSILLLLGVFLFCITTSVSAQVLETPIVSNNEGSACDLTGTTDFPLAISFTTTAFNDDNEFIIELSDKNGSFDNASDVIELRKLISTAANNYNVAFNINTSFQLPSGVFGTNYRIRVRTTSPEMESISDPFEAYYDMFGESELGINNDEEFTLCGDETKEVSLNTNIIGEYIWFRRVGGTDTEVGRTQEPKFTITQSGVYFVVIDYGACGGPKSRFLNVTGISNADAAIKGDSVVEICGDESHTFESLINDLSFTYNWYLDNVLKQSSNTSTYTTPIAGQFGKYKLEIVTSSCTTTSNEVELKQKGTPSFTIAENVPLASLLMPGETKDLSISVNGASSFVVEWYKVVGNNLERLFGVSGTTLSNINQPGCYVARVVESNAGGCLVVADSKPMCLSSIKEISTVIVADDAYKECNSTNIKLSIDQVRAVGDDDNEYVLTSEQLTFLSYQWNTKLGGIVIGATTQELSLNSPLENETYFLEVIAGAFARKPSNELEIKLFIDKPLVTSSTDSNSLCAGSTITYTIEVLEVGYSYVWLKDGNPIPGVSPNSKELIVDEVGEYSLVVTGNGCDNIITETINVIPFDDSAIKITPSERLVLVQGQTAIVTAEGAESYEWIEVATGRIESTSNFLEVNRLGIYQLIARVGACEIIREIEVVEQDDLVIVPNVVTPNGDGKNDTWKISNRYAFQPSVTVIIYNSEGKELVNLTDYKNDWPLEDIKNQRVFYYRIIRDDKTLKAGTISVLH